MGSLGVMSDVRMREDLRGGGDRVNFRRRAYLVGDCVNTRPRPVLVNINDNKSIIIIILPVMLTKMIQFYCYDEANI